MKLSDIILKAQNLLAENGDLEILTEDDYAVKSLYVEVVTEDYPEEYDMPKGFKFVRICNNR